MIEGRMLTSPFAFLRESAVVMASDLAATPVTGSQVVLCGDAHLSNFSIFATSERNLVFDINDFDETYPGPWEWNLKRLAASAVVTGRENGFRENVCQDLVAPVARSYREAMQRFVAMAILDVWYYHLKAESVLKTFDEYTKNNAHARTGDESVISSYMSSETVFDKAIGDFAVVYADQTESDYQAIVEAVHAGRIKAQTGI